MVIELTWQNIVTAAAIIWAVYKAICFVFDRYEIGNKRKECKYAKKSNMVLMREVIRYAHNIYTKEGWIDNDELEHLEHVYEIYHYLGGNGTAERWMEEMRELPRTRPN